MNKQDLLKEIWPVNTVIESFIGLYPENYQRAAALIHRIIRLSLEDIRKQVLSGELNALPGLPDVINNIKLILERKLKNNLQPVINATGIILNTNLGRAPLAECITGYLKLAASGYCNLEYNLEQGSRGSRQESVESVLQELTGTEAAFIVNNNAAAVFLICNTFARNKEVIVSRGELIEIGGSFRLPEIIRESSSRLVEVGTTNKTYLADYQKAIGPATGILMKSHTSNYKITGFTGEVTSSELASLGKEKNIISFEDIGSGLLINAGLVGLEGEPEVTAKVKEGLDLICFSGDKLLGGPQAGIILGKKSLIEELKANPLARVIRIDKLSLLALEATLRLYFLDKSVLISSIPVLEMIALSYSEIEAFSLRVTDRLKKLKLMAEFEIIEGTSQVGGGSFPDNPLRTPIISINPLNISVNRFSESLRQNIPPVLGRTEKNRFLLNLRTVRKNQEEELITAIQLKLA